MAYNITHTNKDYSNWSKVMYLNAWNQEIAGSSIGGSEVGTMEYQASEPVLNPPVVTYFFFYFSQKYVLVL